MIPLDKGKTIVVYINLTMDISKIKPLGDRVLVKPLNREEKTKSGIIIPETSKERPEEGQVLAIGPGAINDKGERKPIEVKVGQKVMFTKYGPNEIKVENEELLIVSEKDILAIIEE